MQARKYGALLSLSDKDILFGLCRCSFSTSRYSCVATFYRAVSHILVTCYFLRAVTVIQSKRYLLFPDSIQGYMIDVLFLGTSNYWTRLEFRARKKLIGLSDNFICHSIIGCSNWQI